MECLTLCVQCQFFYVLCYLETRKGFYLMQRLSETLKVVLVGTETLTYSDTSFLRCATGAVL
jgi:hypothetical protein